MSTVNTIHETGQYAEWFNKLRDIKGKARIATRVDSAKAGNFGAYKVLDDGVCEMKIDFGPGYRVLGTRGLKCVSFDCRRR
ncbi:MAG: hypothetical protein LBU39_03685 [Desulfobulbaceae bacterium]|jgi:putative addiction module killer protein|nr:hypothetical protein [Desulfobulbaceae bacterium]